MQLMQCPACEGEFDPISSYTLPITFQSGKSQFTQQPYNICVCRNCGLHFKDNILSQDEFVSYYQKVDFGKWNINKFFPPEEIVLDYLSTETTRLEILDFGCSEGRLLSTFVGKHACYGFDYNKESLIIAEKKGIRVFYEIAELESQIQKFDVILLIDVFEHLPNPDETLGKLAGLLAPNGRLIISTGFADSKAYRKHPAEFWYFLNLEHICMISEKYIAHLDKLYGFKIVLKEAASHYNPKITLRVRFWLNQLFYWNTLGLRKFSWMRKLFPLNRIFRLEHYPYYPITKDHIVLGLQKPAASTAATH